MSHEKKNNRTLVLDSIVTLIFCQLETYERFKLRSLQWMMRTAPPVANHQQMWDVQEILSVIYFQRI